MRRKVVFWSLAATASLVFVAVFGVPTIATHLAPLVPHRVERLLGNAVDAQIRAMLDTRKPGVEFEYTPPTEETSPFAALKKLQDKS